MVNWQGRGSEAGHKSSGNRLSREAPVRDHTEVAEVAKAAQDSLAATNSSRGAIREQPHIVQQRHGVQTCALRDADDNLPQTLTNVVRHAAAVAELQ